MYTKNGASLTFEEKRLGSGLHSTWHAQIDDVRFRKSRQPIQQLYIERRRRRRRLPCRLLCDCSVTLLSQRLRPVLLDQREASQQLKGAPVQRLVHILQNHVLDALRVHTVNGRQRCVHRWSSHLRQRADVVGDRRGRRRSRAVPCGQPQQREAGEYPEKRRCAGRSALGTANCGC